MKLKLTKPEAVNPAGAQRRWPGHLFNGRVRISTVVLIIAFAAVWWVYDSYRTEPTPPAAPQVVPPGFIPDPAFTWVPRTRLQQPPATVTETFTPTPTTTETTPPPSESPTPVPGFPFCPPLCPPPTTAPPPPEQVPPSSPGSPPAAPGVPTPSAPPGAPPGPATSHPATPHPAAP